MQNHKAILLTLSLTAALSAPALTVDFSSFALPEETVDTGPVPGGDVSETTDPFGPDSGLLITTEGLWDIPGGIELGNQFNEMQNPPGTLAYTYWSGWAISNSTDNTTPGFGNEGSAYPGGGASVGGETEPGTAYSVFFDGNIGSDAIVLPSGMAPQGFYVTNTTYAALAMKDGDSFSRQFEQGDWFQLLIVGLNAEGTVTGQLPFFLADYRDADPAKHYILDAWEWIDLRGLGHETVKVQFYFYSSDVGEYGINTPTYIAMDNLTATATALAGSSPVSAGWSVSPWFGEYYDNELPWIYHNDLGWLYLDATSVPTDVTFYSNLTGWTYTDESSYPWLYSFQSDGWLYYIKNTVNPWLFYNLETGEITEYIIGQTHE